MRIRTNYVPMFVVAAILLAAPSVTHAVSWNFSNDTLNGWTQVNGSANFAGSGVQASQNGSNNAHDAAHDVGVFAERQQKYRVR